MEQTFVYKFVASAVTPGIPPVLVQAIHATFAILLVVLLAILGFGSQDAKFHAKILLALTVALYASVIWYLVLHKRISACRMLGMIDNNEIAAAVQKQKEEKEKKEKEEKEGKKEASTTKVTTVKKDEQKKKKSTNSNVVSRKSGIVKNKKT